VPGVALRFPDQRPPIPPLDLVQRVVPPFTAAEAGGARQAFDEAATGHLVELERALAVVDREFSSFRRLLDFGCGPGRYIRHLGGLAETAEIHGADIDPQAIEWLREHVPYGQFEAIPHEPPTAYPDGHFDLILNHSVFTHLPAPLQDAWMGELQRITEPGGILLLTIHSTPQFNQAIHDIEQDGGNVAQLRATLEQDGVLFIADDHFIGSTHPDFYHTTFHAPWYVFEHWTQWFDLLAYVPQGSDTQDLIVMRRRAEGAPAQRPMGHRDVAAERAEESAAEAQVSGHLGMLGHLLMTRPQPQTTLGRIRRRLLARDLDRQEQVNQALVLALNERDRELRMIRTGLYELGQRLSFVADELRGERQSESATSGAGRLQQTSARPGSGGSSGSGP
jgi:SAM-dependent methyltransferase